MRKILAILPALQHVGCLFDFRSIRVSSNWRQIQKETELYVYTQITDIYM